ncbi:MAG TPA: TRAM domain-containing protein, partial [Polyangiaceae bacterium]|nr:TRAM domain-containing protein [Polyangiaceae bacterium]
MSSGASAGPDQSGASGQLGASGQSSESGEIRVERIAPGGAGLVREASGRVVFVPGALPGDRLRLGVVQARRGVAFAESFELLGE